MHKAGFVNIVGNPNVGKSTLMNQLVGERISIATFKAQTTRHRIMGIVNTDDMQIVFSDTPGVLKPNYKLQESMLAFSESALADADVLLYVTDVVEKPEKNMDFLEKVQKMKKPVILLINKIDVLGTDNSGQEKNVENSKPTHKSSPKNAQRSARLRQETLSKQSEERTLIAPCSPFIAIGEVGLDFYWSREFAEEQLEAFEEQVRWSVETRLPLMIHCRKAQNEMVSILKKYAKELPGGVFHCFTGNNYEAEELLRFDGFVLGIGGVLTFKKSHLPEVLCEVPLSRIVLETDSPYMAPVPMRGKRNESAYVVHVLKKLAESLGVSEEEVARQTNENVHRVFGIS